MIGDKLFSVIEDKRSKSAYHRGSSLKEQQFISRKFDQNFMILAYAYASPLKSLCRRIIKKNILRNKENFHNPRLKKLSVKTDLRKYLCYKA